MKEVTPKNAKIPSQKCRCGVQDHNERDCEPHEDNERLLCMQSQQHHNISADVRHKVHISTWLGDAQDDPALVVRFDIAQYTVVECVS